MKSYDIVCVVSNDIAYDRRMIRTCQTLSEAGKKVLLLGRVIEGRNYEDNFIFDTHRLLCRHNSGPRFYKEILEKAHSFLNPVSYTHLTLPTIYSV